MDGHTTDNWPWHKLVGLRPVELKIVEKGKMLLTSIFSFFQYVFNPINSLPHNPNFNDPKGECFGKHYGKSRKCWLPAFSPFPTMFSIQSKTETIILATLNLLSAMYQQTFNTIAAKLKQLTTQNYQQFVHKLIHWHTEKWTERQISENVV